MNIKKASYTGLLTIGLAMGAISVSETANAGSDQKESMVVNYSELDINSDKGAQILYRRITRAAKKVCGENNSRISINERNKIKKCVSEAVENAVAATDLPKLHALHFGEDYVQTRYLAQKD